MISMDPLSLLPSGLILGLLAWFGLSFLAQPEVSERLSQTYYIPLCERGVAIQQSKAMADSPPPSAEPVEDNPDKSDQAENLDAEKQDEPESPPGPKKIIADNLRPYVHKLTEAMPSLPIIPSLNQFLDTLEQIDAAERAIRDQARAWEELKQQNMEKLADIGTNATPPAMTPWQSADTINPPSTCTCAVTKAFGDMQWWMTLHVATLRHYEPADLKNISLAIGKNLKECSHA